MITIIATAIGAVAAISTYNKSAAAEPAKTTEKVTSIRQAVAVVLAIGEAIWSVLDALIFVTRGRSSRVEGTGTPLRKFGNTMASEAT